MEDYELAIDSEDTYLDQPNVFYIHPGRISTVRCVANIQFSSASIKNSPVNSLTSLNLVAVLEKMKQNAPLEVYIDQPITVMQEYDAKQVEANLKLAGFDEISINSGDYVKQSTGKKIETLVVSCIKPIKNPNAVEITVTTQTKKKVSKK